MSKDDEVEKRILAAREEADRQKQTKEFLEGLTKNDELLKPIYNPEAFIMRDKYRGAANRGELQRTNCNHPLSMLQQYEDTDPLVIRKGNPLNLFECGQCHLVIWLVDPWGTPISDN